MNGFQTEGDGEVMPDGRGALVGTVVGKDGRIAGLEFTPRHDAAEPKEAPDYNAVFAKVREWISLRGQISGSLASQRKHDAEGAKLLRELARTLPGRIGKTREPNTPISELLREYERECCDFSDMEWVRKASLRYVKTMPDSQVRCLLYALAQQPAAAVPEVLVRAYFHRFSEVEDDYTIYHTLDGVCEQCIPVLIVRDTAMLAAARKGE